MLQGDQDPELAAFETPRLIAELERRGRPSKAPTDWLIAELEGRGYRVTQARQRRTQRPAGEPRRSKSADLDDAAKRGVMPTKPDVTSHANHHYQKRFERRRRGGAEHRRADVVTKLESG